MTEKVYSALDCGCYYTKGTQVWVLCIDHAKEKQATTYKFDQQNYLNEKIAKQKIQTEKLEKLGIHSQRLPSSQHLRPTTETTQQNTRHSIGTRRTFYPTGIIDVAGTKMDRILTIPQQNKSDINTARRYYWLYALSLENHKYYIGMTGKSNPLYRIEHHLLGLGALWTQQYKPLRVLEIIDIGKVTKRQAEQMENDLTLLYMKKHGRRNVRGGYMATPGWLFFTAHKPTSRRPLNIERITEKYLIPYGFWALVVLAFYYFL